METVNSTSRTLDFSVRVVPVSFALSVLIETGSTKKRAPKIKRDLFAVAKHVVRSLKNLNRIYKKLWRQETMQPYTRCYRASSVLNLTLM